MNVWGGGGGTSLVLDVLLSQEPGFLLGIFSGGGAKSIVMLLFVFGTNFREGQEFSGGKTASGGAPLSPPVEESQETSTFEHQWLSRIILYSLTACLVKFSRDNPSLPVLLWLYQTPCLTGDFRSWESPETLPALFIGPFEHVERFRNLKFVEGDTRTCNPWITNPVL